MRRVFVFLVVLSWYCIMIEAAPPTSTAVVIATGLPAVCHMGSPSGSSTASDTDYIAVERASEEGTPRAVTPVDKDAEWVIIAPDRDHGDLNYPNTHTAGARNRAADCELGTPVQVEVAGFELFESEGGTVDRVSHDPDSCREGTPPSVRWTPYYNMCCGVKSPSDRGCSTSGATPHRIPSRGSKPLALCGTTPLSDCCGCSTPGDREEATPHRTPSRPSKPLALCGTTPLSDCCGCSTPGDYEGATPHKKSSRRPQPLGIHGTTPPSDRKHSTPSDPPSVERFFPAGQSFRDLYSLESVAVAIPETPSGVEVRHTFESSNPARALTYDEEE